MRTKFVMRGLPWDKLEKDYEDLMELLRKHVGVYSFKSPKTIDKGLKWMMKMLRNS